MMHQTAGTPEVRIHYRGIIMPSTMLERALFCVGCICNEHDREGLAQLGRDAKAALETGEVFAHNEYAFEPSALLSGVRVQIDPMSDTPSGLVRFTTIRDAWSESVPRSIEEDVAFILGARRYARCAQVIVPLQVENQLCEFDLGPFARALTHAKLSHRRPDIGANLTGKTLGDLIVSWCHRRRTDAVPEIELRTLSEEVEAKLHILGCKLSDFKVNGTNPTYYQRDGDSIFKTPIASGYGEESKQPHISLNLATGSLSNAAQTAILALTEDLATALAV